MRSTLFTVSDILTRSTAYFQTLVGERGARLRHHIRANSEGYPVTHILKEDLRKKITAKKGVIFMDKLSMLPAIHRWCVETDDFYHIGNEALAELSGNWVTARQLGREFNAAMDMKYVLSDLRSPEVK